MADWDHDGQHPTDKFTNSVRLALKSYACSPDTGATEASLACCLHRDLSVGTLTVDDVRNDRYCYGRTLVTALEAWPGNEAGDCSVDMFIDQAKLAMSEVIPGYVPRMLKTYLLSDDDGEFDPAMSRSEAVVVGTRIPRSPTDTSWERSELLCELPGSEDLVGGPYVCNLVSLRSGPPVQLRGWSCRSAYVYVMHKHPEVCADAVVDFDLIRQVLEDLRTADTALLFDDPNYSDNLPLNIRRHYVGDEMEYDFSRAKVTVRIWEHERRKYLWLKVQLPRGTNCGSRIIPPF